MHTGDKSIMKPIPEMIKSKIKTPNAGQTIEDGKKTDRFYRRNNAKNNRQVRKNPESRNILEELKLQE